MGFAFAISYESSYEFRLKRLRRNPVLNGQLSLVCPKSSNNPILVSFIALNNYFLAPLWMIITKPPFRIHDENHFLRVAISKILEN